MASGEDSMFPFLAADRFDCACKAFVRRVDAAGGAQSLGWLAVEYLRSELENPILRISKSASIPRAPLENSNAIATERIGSPRDLEEDVIEDDDQGIYALGNLDSGWRR
uniref:Alanine--tRNA ligase n=1 Tax=Talaromyces marneffei PM1 TaxID=1077442 RepID=A0A093UYZ6_TALMA